MDVRWKSMEVHGSPWKSMDVHGGPWRSMEVHGGPWIFIDFRKFSRSFRWLSEVLMNFRRGAQNGWKSRKTMFCVFYLFTPLYRRFSLSRVSQTRELEEIYRLVSNIRNFTPCGSVFGRFCVLWKNVVESPSKAYLKSI